MTPDFYDAPASPESQVARPGAVVREQSTYMTDKDAEKLCQLFADGLRSGIGYARILDFMERQKIDRTMTQRLRAAVLEHGDQLGEAFARFGILDAAARKLILVAEEQGALPETFREQARIFGMRWKRKRQIAFGLVEPMIVVALGAIVFRNVMGSLMAAAMAKDMWAVLTDTFIKSGIQSAIFFLFVGGIGYVWINMPVDSSLRETLGRIWFRMPIVSTPLRLEAVGMFARYMRQSIRSGMDIFRSLELAADATNNPWFLETVDQAFQVLEAGYPLDQALRQIKGIPDEFIDYVAIGEETGRLEENLLFIADRYEEKASEAYEKSLAAFVYIARIGLIILIFIFAIFGGVMDMATNF